MKIFLLFTIFSSLLACENCKGGASGCDYLYYSELVFPVMSELPVILILDMFYQKMNLREGYQIMLELWLIWFLKINTIIKSLSKIQKRKTLNKSRFMITHQVRVSYDLRPKCTENETLDNQSMTW